MLSSYFDLRARRLSEERQEERRREERRQDADAAERRRQEEERRHQELMALLAAVLNNGRAQGNGQSQGELIRSLQQTIEDLRAENDRLRREQGNGDDTSQR